MQGQKKYTEKLFMSFQLSEHVPEDNFYRRLKEVLDFSFMRKLTASFYGDCGQKSIDPEVFMKLMLVSYLENITSDRKLMSHCAMRMDILYFLGYDIDEPLPWYSTLSRTRSRIPAHVFEEAFYRVLSICVEAGMVAGHTQAIDSAPIKANASMDSLELKVPAEELKAHLRKIRAQSLKDREEDDEDSNSGGPKRKAKKNRAKEEDRKVNASKAELQEIASRNQRWRIEQDMRPGANHAQSKYTSNKTHYSPVDPDARISVKPGKARKLNYHAQMAVDTAHHVITHMSATHADRVDSLCLPEVVKSLQTHLHRSRLLWRNVLADAGYSSGENYAMLEQSGLESYIPPHGTYKGGPEGFTYHEDGDYWLCSQGEKVTFRKVVIEKSGNKKKLYLTKPSQCKGCPVGFLCKKRSPERRITITYYKEEYERAIERVKSRYGQYLKHKRSSTVEPVFGILTQHMGLRKINTRGIANAEKVMLASAMAYNLKKYLKFTKAKAQSKAKEAQQALWQLFYQIGLILSPFKSLNFTIH